MTAMTMGIGFGVGDPAVDGAYGTGEQFRVRIAEGNWADRLLAVMVDQLAGVLINGGSDDQGDA
ncbi:hypothetical protein [Streptomyces sp. NPDC058086]|uniref:hypothetical protein n=1 Tax=Streptomyces sp. NPDC058086 TaxID=3346334 RepID=UPI0036F16E4B